MTIASSLPVSLCEGNHVVRTIETSPGFGNVPAVFATMLGSTQSGDPQRLELLWLERTLFAARIQVPESTLAVVVGPVLTARASASDLGDLLAKSQFSYDATRATVSHLADAMPVDISVAYSCINILYVALYQEGAGAEQLRLASPGEGRTAYATIEDEAEIAFAEQNEEFVNEMTSIIARGATDELEVMIAKEKVIPYGRLGRSTLRHFKNSCIVSVYITRRAAAAGGLDESTCVRLAAAYTMRFEDATTLQEITAISREMRREYCQRVHDLKLVDSSNELVLSAVSYISNHRTEKIEVSAIANSLFVSAPYLSRLFKKETGMSVVDFIQRMKVDYARMLLRYSTYSLAEVSEYLSFSSQSHFQTVFKKVAGCTPGKYRHEVAGRFPDAPNPRTASGITISKHVQR